MTDLISVAVFLNIKEQSEVMFLLEFTIGGVPSPVSTKQVKVYLPTFVVPFK